VGRAASTVDPNNETTTYAYDPLGRVTGTWLPGQPTTSAANCSYAYSLTATAPPTVATTKLVGPQDIPITSYQIYDSLLRPRQTQSPAEGPAGGSSPSGRPPSAPRPRAGGVCRSTSAAWQ
jgi:YD repeat-containing protein